MERADGGGWSGKEGQRDRRNLCVKKLPLSPSRRRIVSRQQKREKERQTKTQDEEEDREQDEMNDTCLVPHTVKKKGSPWGNYSKIQKKEKRNTDASRVVYTLPVISTQMPLSSSTVPAWRFRYILSTLHIHSKRQGPSPGTLYTIIVGLGSRLTLAPVLRLLKHGHRTPPGVRGSPN